MTKPRICECCGQIIPPPNPFHDKPVKRLIYDYIAKHPEGVTRGQIMDTVYANSPDGGPEWANVISVHVKKMNAELAKRGLRIKSTMGPQSIYRLQEL